MNEIKPQIDIENRFVRLLHLRVFKGRDDRLSGSSLW